MYTVITLAAALLFVFIYSVIFKSKDKDKHMKNLKILSLIFCVTGVVRMFLSDAFVETVLDSADVLQSILRWIYYVGYTVIPLSIFLDSRLLKNISVYFSLPVSLLCTVFFEDTFSYFTAEGANGFVLPIALRYVFYIFELTLSISIPLITAIKLSHRFDIKSKEEIRNIVLALPAILLFVMPAYIPQSLIGYTDIDAKSFGAMHLAWIAVIIITCVALYLLFRKRSDKDKYNLCVFIALVELIHTHSVFLRGFTISRIPLQLCCVSGFFYVIALAMKKRGLFDFCYLANTIGAVIAIALASFSSEALTFWNVHYMQEHLYVFIVPVLTMALHVFPRIERSAIKHTLVVFCIYFFSIFVIGTLINGLSNEEGYAVNYFYMFNYSVAISYLPFATFTGAWHIVIGSFEIYPILVVTIFVLFSLLFILLYFLTQLIYKISDHIENKKYAKKDNDNIDILTTV